MISFLRASCVVVVLLLSLKGAMAGSLVDTLDKGPKIGERIPSALSALDQDKRNRDFASLTGERGLILVFFRKMILCPSCELRAAVWNKNHAEIRALGYNIAAVTSDTGAIIARVSQRRKLRFPLLEDKNSEIIGAFGLIDESYAQDSVWRGVARPMVFVIDTKGVVTHRFSNRNFRDRPDIGAMMQRVRESVHGQLR